jgi:photosystem II stability/assembly factor-like uncharacterized protein
MSPQQKILSLAMITVFMILGLPVLAQDWNEIRMKPGVTLNDLYMHTDGMHGWAVGASVSSGYLLAVVLRTTDGGEMWETDIFPYPYVPNAVCFATPERGWIACSEGRIYYSDDGGLSWEPQASPTYRKLSAISFVSEEEGWITGGWSDGSSYLVLHTTNGGTIWETQSFGSTCYSCEDIHFSDNLNGWICGYDNQLNGHIHHTSDGGVNWVRQTIPAGNGQVSSLTFANAKIGWATTSSIYASPSGAILYTKTGGATWVTQGYTNLHYNYAIDAQDSLCVAITSAQVLSPAQQAVVTTSDGGENWNSATVPMFAYSHAIQYVDDSIRLTGDESRILRTDDLGAKWTWENYGAWWQGVGWRDEQTGWVVTVDYGGTIGFAMRTDNGGATWEDDPNAPGGSQVLFADYANGWMFMSGSNARIWRTVDGGNNWTQHFIGASNWADEVFFINSDRGWTCGSGGMIRRTDNGGQNWIPQTSGTGSYVEVIFFVDENEGWAAGGYGGGNGFIRHTTDGGDTWDYQPPASSGHHQAGFFLDNQRGWLVDVGGHVHRTLNGGAFWQIIGVVNHTYIYDIYMEDDQVGWLTAGNPATSGGNGLGYIYKTENGGVTWTLSWVTPWPRGWVNDISRQPGGPLWVCGAHATLLVNGDLAAVPGSDDWGTHLAFYPPAPSLLRDATRLSWQLGEPGQVRCSVFDVRGRCMRTLLDAVQPAGRHGLTWNGEGSGGRRLPAGIYFVRLEVNDRSHSQRVIVR